MSRAERAPAEGRAPIPIARLGDEREGKPGDDSPGVSSEGSGGEARPPTGSSVALAQSLAQSPADEAAGPPARSANDPFDPYCGGGRFFALQPALYLDADLRAIIAAAGWRQAIFAPRDHAMTQNKANAGQRHRRCLHADDIASNATSNAASNAKEGNRANTAIFAWGARRAAWPARALARRLDRRLISLEDAPLRSIAPGPRRGPPAGITLDDRGPAFDAQRASRLERLIAALSARPIDPLLHDRARRALDRLIETGLSKYTPHPRGQGVLPQRGAVLVVDQVAGDAALGPPGAAAGLAAFRAMLAAARAENAGRPVIIRRHPDPRAGHFTTADIAPGTGILDPRTNPWEVLERVSAVYTISSQLGLEAALMGVETHVFGRPAYAGWGLTHDRIAIPRRYARPDRETLFAATHLIYPLWWDPHDRCPTDFETALDILEDRARTERRDPVAPRALTLGIAPWKRRHVGRFLPDYLSPPRHYRRLAGALRAAEPRSSSARIGLGQPAARLWVWSASAPDALDEDAATLGIPVGRIEDGFLRSAGLGARLVPAASLVLDERGIHYDPARLSDLEHLIAHAACFRPGDPRLGRAASLRRSILAAGISKYHGVGASARGSSDLAVPDLRLSGDDAGDQVPSLRRAPSDRHVILVPGQVSDDASVRLGTAGGAVRDNLALLKAARRANPTAHILYKPHPDVEAGLRQGRVSEDALCHLADEVLRDCHADAAMARADAVWTMTSGLGFEALMRGIPVFCLGAPFYAGWGLTTDLGPVPTRRRLRPSLDALIWAALIAYPVYVHPLSGLATRPERIVAHFAAGGGDAAASTAARFLAPLQEAMAALGLVRWR